MLFNFEWDPYKAKLNVQKHGVAFEHAAEVFQDSMLFLFLMMNTVKMKTDGLHWERVILETPSL